MALENKLGLTSSADLAREEERISKKKAAELFEKGILDNLPAGKFSTLQAIHKYLFEDIYDFAGELRTVNLAKGNFRFAPLMYLQAALENIDKMPQSNFDEIIEKYVEMNIAHPFREGNGRSTRIWLDHILKNKIGKVVDWSKVDKEDYLLAMERSPIKDGFIDRYSGERLVNPGLLKVISFYLPNDFPYHPHWKMDKCHNAYWELIPTLDHIYPIALGGADSEENYATTSMLHNSIKNNWTLEQLQWSLYPPGDIKDWDGLTHLFISLVAADKQLLNDSYIKKWYILSTKEELLSKPMNVFVEK